jgi:hypothetical protein
MRRPEAPPELRRSKRIVTIPQVMDMELALWKGVR